MEKISVLASALILVLVMITASVFNNGLTFAKEEGSNGGDSSDAGSGSGSGDSGGGSSSNDNSGGSSSDTPTTTDKEHKDIPAATPSDNSSPTDTTTTKQDMTKPIKPANPNANGEQCAQPNRICPPSFSPSHNPKNTINFGCHFHPNDDRCKPAIPGQCPGGFASNDKGNCHPIGPCPFGFSRHDNDESGQCFKNPGSHFPPFVHCGRGFDVDHGKCVKIEIIKIVHHSDSSSSSSSGSGSSHSLSAKCFDSIKIAWIGKIHRGENHDVDKIIDKCLGV